MIDRSAASQALAKAIAYKQCGKDLEATRWAIRLLQMLEMTEILEELPIEEIYNGFKELR